MAIRAEIEFSEVARAFRNRLNRSLARGILNRLKEIVIDPFDRVRCVRGHRHIECDHEFSQP